MNGSGVRDICRVLHISINTVLKTIKEQAAEVPKPKLPERLTDLEVDEMWAYVGKKANERWLWYGFDAKSKQVVSWLSAPHTKASCRQLLKSVSKIQILRYLTDRLKWYGQLIESEHHWVGKEWTQGIERNNLNFRTHLKRFQRRTICFSKSEVMHEAVLKLYVHHLNSQQHKL